MRTTYIGMDIHKNFIQAVAMDEHGNILKEQKLETERDKIKLDVKFEILLDRIGRYFYHYN